MARTLQYLVALLAVYALFGVSIAWFGARVPPYAGDLTRLGGYSEADYAWTKPQQRYQPPLYRQAERYEGATDVLVLGDSMSLHNVGEQTDPGSYWPNHLAAASGWRVSALHRGAWPLDDLLAAPPFRDAPPRVLVLQFAERAITALGRITAAASDGHCNSVQHRAPAAMPLRPLHAQPEVWRPPATTAEGVDFSRGANHLKRRLMNALRPGWNQTLRFELSQSGLFSSRADRSLLVYADDVAKLGVHAAHIEQQRCALLAIQNRVQAAGVAHFMVLVVPDKLSVYRRQITEIDQRYPQVIAALARDPALHLPRLDSAFDAAVDAGLQDLFLPNDTHPGVAGHQLIADAVLRHLVEVGIVVR